MYERFRTLVVTLPHDARLPPQIEGDDHIDPIGASWVIIPSIGANDGIWLVQWLEMDIDGAVIAAVVDAFHAILPGNPLDAGCGGRADIQGGLAVILDIDAELF